MLQRRIRDDPQRFRETYWSRFPGRYFAGDGAKRDKDGYLWLLGRVDDVMKISGHRISTTEVESALVSHPKVAEAAVIGRDDPITTPQAIFAFVTLRSHHQGSDAFAADLREPRGEGEIGAIARPRQIMFTPELPKTRCGKIMRRLLRDIANGRPRWAIPRRWPIPRSSTRSSAEPPRRPPRTDPTRKSRQIASLPVVGTSGVASRCRSGSPDKSRHRFVGTSAGVESPDRAVTLRATMRRNDAMGAVAELAASQHGAFTTTPGCRHRALAAARSDRSSPSRSIDEPVPVCLRIARLADRPGTSD